MKCVLLGLGAVLLAGSTVVAGSYVYTFDAGNQGWTSPTITSGGNFAYPGSTWLSTGGNPDGHITGTVDNDSTRLYVMQPADASAFGDMTGMGLTVDYKIAGTVTGPTGMNVRFYLGSYSGGSDYWVTNATYSWNPNSDTDWATHTVNLVESNFIKWPNQNTGSKTFAQVVADADDIGLVFADGFTSNETLGFSSTEGATISLDNFGTIAVPVPAAAWLGLVLLGGIGAVRTYRRRSLC